MGLAAACCWAPAANEAVAASSSMEVAVVRLTVVVCVVTAVGRLFTPDRLAPI